MQTIRKVSVYMMLGFLLSLTLVFPGSTQTLPTFRVEPTYATGRVGEYVDVRTYVYDANMDDHTDVAAYQVCITWDNTVLEMELDAYNAPTGIIFGTFLNVSRIGWWGELTQDAPSGQNVVNVTGGSYYADPSVWGGRILIQDDSNSEWNTVTDVVGNKLTLATNLVNSYTVAANAGAYPKPTLSPGATINYPTNNRIFAGQTTNGPCPGVSGNGWLLTFKFKVLSAATTALNIDAPVVGQYTYIINTLGETVGDAPSGGGDPGNYQSELLKESGTFVPPWPEDVNADGIIDIFDIAYVGIDWGSSPMFTNNPSSNTGGWTTGANAYTSDDVYAGVPKGVTEVYGTYGFSLGGAYSILSVEVGVEGYSEGGEIIRIRVSWDGGSSWGSTHDVTLTASDTLTWVDVTADHAWAPGDLTDGNFVVEATGIAVGGYKPTYVDWIPARVTPDARVSYSQYTDVNGDGLVNIVDLTLVSLKFGETY